ncbi:hypothetical protein Ancab_028025 [Ancistrocladus abbreviatus]
MLVPGSTQLKVPVWPVSLGKCPDCLWKNESIFAEVNRCLNRNYYVQFGAKEYEQHCALARIVRNLLDADRMRGGIVFTGLLNFCEKVRVHVESGAKVGKPILDEVVQLIYDGMESKLVSTLERLLSSYHPEKMDVDLFIFWAEETLVEENLVLDILFLTYYESFCTYSTDTWRKLCLIYKGMICGYFNYAKLAVSDEAVEYIYHAKVQMLLILIETLDLESLLQMIHDEVPFRDGSMLFSLREILEMDAVVSSFDVFEMKEAGPLVLAWAVFLCLNISLLGKEENSELMEIDHVGYVRQAFEAESLSYFREILQSNLLKNDGPVGGYRSILRTFISSFIASYEINVQLEDGTLKLILSLLSEIYRGEESLCIQFWDKDSIVDGPIRCLLCNLEGEFPHRIIELIRLLSALCEGNWPAECVYNFLDKSVGISTLCDINSGMLVDEVSQIVETQLPLHVPGVEGLMIPTKTRGHVLRMVGARTALVRWEYTQSAVFVLLLRLAQQLDLDNNEEVVFVLDMFSRLASFNVAVCCSLMNIGRTVHVQVAYDDVRTESEIRVDVVEVLCNLIRNLPPNCSNVLTMSYSVSILGKMLRWYLLFSREYLQLCLHFACGWSVLLKRLPWSVHDPQQAICILSALSFSIAALFDCMRKNVGKFEGLKKKYLTITAMCNPMVLVQVSTMIIFVVYDCGEAFSFWGGVYWEEESGDMADQWHYLNHISVLWVVAAVFEESVCLCVCVRERERWLVICISLPLGGALDSGASSL